MSHEDKEQKLATLGSTEDWSLFNYGLLSLILGKDATINILTDPAASLEHRRRICSLITRALPADIGMDYMSLALLGDVVNLYASLKARFAEARSFGEKELMRSAWQAIAIHNSETIEAYYILQADLSLHH